MALDLSMYKNPLRGIGGLTPQRIDQGVDYGGSGPIYALGNGIITSTTNSGWPGGAFIAYRLTDGPYKGRYVYAAENITPMVHIGQKVGVNTVIGHLNPGEPDLETGWAAPPGSGASMATATGQWQKDPNHSTGYGVNFDDLLKALGAKGGILQGPVSNNPKTTFPQASGGTPTGGGGGGGGSPTLANEMSVTSIPLPGFGWLPGFSQIAGIGNSIGDVATGIGGITNDLSALMHFVSVLFRPALWLRVGAFFGGLLALAGALFMLAKAAGIGGGGGGAPQVVPIPV